MKLKSLNFITFKKVCILACANTALYGLPYMKSQFYDVLLVTLGLTHTQLSTLFSINGIVCMCAYVFGGLVADCLPIKKAMLFALCASGVLHLYVLTLPTYMMLCIVFALLGVTSILLFYPASMKMLTLIGGGKKNGRVFGDYIAVLDVVGLAIVGVGFLALVVNGNSDFVFRITIFIYALLHFITAFFLYKTFENYEGHSDESKFEWSQVKRVITDSKIVGVIIIIFSNYLMMGALTYAIPFLSNVYGVSDDMTVLFSIVRVNLITIFAAPIAGRFVDKMGSSIHFMGNTFLFSMLLVIIIIVSFFVDMPVWFIVMMILIISTFVTAAKSLNFVVLGEIKVSSVYMGTAIGVVSFLGYSPDAFFYTVAGNWIDKFDTKGYMFIFIAFLFCAIMGWIASKLLYRVVNSKEIKSINDLKKSEH